MSSNDRIQEIRERLEAATSGTWDSCGDAVMAQDGSWVCQMYEGDENDDAPTREFQNATNNSEFIACAPDDIAYLLSEVERLQRENERLSNEMDSLMIALEDRAPYAAQKYWTYLLNEKEKLVEALEWYADEANYIRTEEDYTIGYPPEIRFDRGLKARTALSHLKG